MLVEVVWRRLAYLNGPPESLNGSRFFTIDSALDLEQKWPQILSQKPDFIKVMLWVSGEHERRRHDKAYYGLFGLDPALLPRAVAKAHASGLRVSAHLNNASDFHVAVSAGVDEIAHLPMTALTPIAVEDAKLAARRGIVVVTTCSAVSGLPSPVLPRSDLPQVLKTQLENLKLLREHGVRMAVGSNNPSESSVKEVEYLRALGVLDDLTLLRTWTETTARAIFPQRKLGALKDGYEASFLAWKVIRLKTGKTQEG